MDQKPHVFVTRRIHDDALERLGQFATIDVWDEDGPPSPGDIARRARHASGLIATSADRVDEELLTTCKDLAVVANVAVGYDNLDLGALTARGIPASNTPGVLTDATADLTLGLIIATARRFHEARQVIEQGGWRSWRPDFLLGLELRGATLGIVGTGRIGEAVITRAQALGMEVIAWSRAPRSIPGVRYVEFDEVFAESDVVSLHLALAPETRMIVGARQFSLMKTSAIFINAARGALVDESALIDALRSGSIAAAGLDVYAVEPIGPDHPLMRFANCVLMPHLGSATGATRRAMAQLAVDNVLAGLRGERLANCVNEQVYDTPG